MIYEDDCVRVTTTGARCDKGGTMSRRVRAVEYDHVEDRADVYRRHDFGSGVRMVVLPGLRAALLIGPRGRPIARDF